MPPAPPQLSKAERKKQEKAAKEAKAREAKAAADAKAAQEKAAKEAAQGCTSEGRAGGRRGSRCAGCASSEGRRTEGGRGEGRGRQTRRRAAKPKAPSKGLGAGAWIAIGAVVLALGAGAVLHDERRWRERRRRRRRDAADGALDAMPVEDAPQPLPPELSAENGSRRRRRSPPTAPRRRPARRSTSIVTRPVGATIMVDGKTLEGMVTPAEIELPHDAKHLIQLELEDHKPIRWTFVADRAERGPAAHPHVVLPAGVRVRSRAGARTGAAGRGSRRAAPAGRRAAPAVELPSSPAGVLDKSIKTVRGGREVPMPRKIIDAGAIYDKSIVPTGRQPIVILELTIDPAGPSRQREGAQRPHPRARRDRAAHLVSVEVRGRSLEGEAGEHGRDRHRRVRGTVGDRVQRGLEDQVRKRPDRARPEHV